MKRNNPETSKAAFKSLNSNKLNELHLKILAAMQYIGECTYEDVASHLGLEPQRIWRRMSELDFANRIHRPGGRKVMKSGRQGMVWVLGSDPHVSKKKEKILKGKTVADFSRAILNQAKPNSRVVEKLF